MLPTLSSALTFPGKLAVFVMAVAVMAGGTTLAYAQPGAGDARPDRDRLIERIMQNSPEADTDRDGQLSESELRSFMQARRAERRDDGGSPDPGNREAGPEPTQADVAYGDNARHRLDLYLPDHADAPTPVVVFFHGGGFSRGDKGQVSPRLVSMMNDLGVSVAAVNYRFCQTDPLPAAMLDGARSIQYLRAHAEEYNLDPQRIAVTGGSAGAGISLWIALHDDLADPDSHDPVARESSRVTCALVTQAQVSYDPRFWENLGLGAGLAHRSFAEMYGFDADTPYDNPDLVAAFEVSSPITFLTADDPPLRFDYRNSADLSEDTTMSDLIHHPRQGFAMQKACEPLGVECEVNTLDDGRPEESSIDYFTRHLLTD